MASRRRPNQPPLPVVCLALAETRERSAAWDELWRRLLTIAMEAIEAEDAADAK